MMKFYPLFLFLGLLFSGCSEQLERIEVDHTPARIVSMAPSATEIIYAAGGADRLVGLTRFCVYPEELTELPRIGGLTDTNYEYLYRLQPDLVVIQKEHHVAPERLDKLGIAYRSVDTSSIEMIYDSIRELGEVCQTAEVARASIDDLKVRVAQIVDQTKDAAPRRVLISVSRDTGSGRVSDVYIAGSNTIYDEILRLIGAVNVYSGELSYPQLSTEGIIRLNPDVIIDLQSSLTVEAEQVLADWNALDRVNAVKIGAVHLLNGNYVTIPGPRFVNLMEDIARAVYPESFIGELEDG